MRAFLNNEGAATVVKLEGALVGGELDELDAVLKRLCDTWTKRIVLNLADAPLIDSAALELLCRYQRQLAERGLGLKLCGLNELTARIFELTRLGRRFELYGDTTAAVRSFL